MCAANQIWIFNAISKTWEMNKKKKKMYQKQVHENNMVNLSFEHCCFAFFLLWKNKKIFLGNVPKVLGQIWLYESLVSIMYSQKKKERKYRAWLTVLWIACRHLASSILYWTLKYSSLMIHTISHKIQYFVFTHNVYVMYLFKIHLYDFINFDMSLIFLFLAECSHFVKNRPVKCSWTASYS